MIIGETLTFDPEDAASVPLLGREPLEFGRPPLELQQQPPLALVNRQIRAETLSLFYGNNMFCITGIMISHNWERAKRWFEATQPYLHTFKSILMSPCCYEFYVIFKAKPGSRSTFAASCETASCGLYDRGAKRLFQDGGLHALCDSVGHAGFGLDEYIRAGDMLGYASLWYEDEDEDTEPEGADALFYFGEKDKQAEGKADN